MFAARSQKIRADIRAQKLFAMKVLRALEEIDGKPKYLMGGAPRNWRYNKTAVDYDVYLPSNIELEDVENVLRKRIDACLSFGNSLPVGHHYGNLIHSTYHAISTNVKDFSERDINIVLYDKDVTAETILHKNFGFTISQAVMTSSGTMMFTDGFEETFVTNKVQALNGLRRDSNYAKKIESYFPQHQFIYE